MEFKPNLSLPLKLRTDYEVAETSLYRYGAATKSCDGSKQRKSPTTLVGSIRIRITDSSLTNSHCDGSMANLVRGPKEADNTDDTASQRDSEQPDGSTD